VLRLRVRSQQLTGQRATDVAEVVRRMGALQAQSTRDARLAVRPRGTGIDAAAVVRACHETRSVVRTWAMRGTLQMLSARDAGWIIDLYRPSPGVLNARQRELGLTADLLGYRSRDMALPPRFARRIQAGGGWIRAALIVDGRVAGTWAQQRTAGQTVVTVQPFERLDPAVLPGLEAEATDLGRFQGTPASLHVASG
jgi:hypothetical protein